MWTAREYFFLLTHILHYSSVLLTITRLMIHPTSFLQPVLPPLHIIPPVMAGIFQRTLKLRAALRHLSPHSTFSSTATARLSPARPHSPFLPTASRQFEVCRRALHTGADKPSPAAAPDRLPFSRITQEDLDFFRKILPGRAITAPDLLESSNVDWLKSVRGDDD